MQGTVVRIAINSRVTEQGFSQSRELVGVLNSFAGRGILSPSPSLRVCCLDSSIIISSICREIE